MSLETYRQEQRDYHEHADAEHFRWQTAAPFIARSEAALLDGVRTLDGERLLEIGCGEGGNLHHLQARGSGAQLFGVDFSAQKAAFARGATGCACAQADATRLPFDGGTFDAVLIRDLLHHLPDRAGALAEAYRVLKPGGRLTLLEPNRGSPLVWLQVALVRAERGALVSTGARLRRELEQAGFTVGSLEPRQPLPLARVVLHPRLGAPSLGAVPTVARALDAAETLAGRLLPRRAWMYLLVQAIRSHQDRASHRNRQ